MGPELLLRRLDGALDSGLGSLRAGVDPMLADVRRSVAALYPGPEQAPLAPKQRQAERERLGQLLDTLEDVLEALQVAAHHRDGER
jgi:hypothetical protein